MALLSSAARNSTTRAMSSGYQLPLQALPASSAPLALRAQPQRDLPLGHDPARRDELTRILSGPQSRASERVSPEHRRLRRRVGRPCRPARPSRRSSPMLMIEPPPACSSSGRPPGRRRTGGCRFTANRSSQYSGVTVSNGCRSSRAALLTRTRDRPVGLAAPGDRRAQGLDVAQVAGQEQRRRQPSAASAATSCLGCRHGRCRRRRPCCPARRTGARSGRRCPSRRR